MSIRIGESTVSPAGRPTCSATAVRDALRQADLAPDDVTALVVNTCTGYICPGLSTT